MKPLSELPAPQPFDEDAMFEAAAAASARVAAERPAVRAVVSEYLLLLSPGRQNGFAASKGARA